MTPHHPPFQIVLSPAQSAAFRESGIGFVTGAPSHTSPGTLLCFECDHRTATAAARVAQGTHLAVRKKPEEPQKEAGPF